MFPNFTENHPHHKISPHLRLQLIVRGQITQLPNTLEAALALIAFSQNKNTTNSLHRLLCLIFYLF